MPSKARKAAKSSRTEPAIRRVVRVNIRNRRMERGIKQKELGDWVGTTQSWIQQIESKQRSNFDVIPSLFLLHQIAAHLGCSVADLCTPGRFRSRVSPNDDLRKYRGQDVRSRQVFDDESEEELQSLLSLAGVSKRQTKAILRKVKK